jgi:penicillin-binding protein 2
MENRVTIAIYIVIFIFSVFMVRLWDLQIIKGKEYKKINERNRLRIIDIPAPRGIIYDRNNKVLVKNVPSFDISIVKEDIPGDRETAFKLGRLIGLSLDEINSNISKASTIPFSPVKLKKNVSFEEIAKVEAGKIDFPGLHVEVVSGREYVYRHAASHVLGYLGRLSLDQLRTITYRGTHPETVTGRFGVEKVHNAVLGGIPGKKIIEVDAMGRIIKIVRILRPIKGNNIKLTIDIDLQVEAEESLRGKVGAVVAIDIDTGEVLALASAPSFDPNLFVRGIGYKDWQKLMSNPRKPLLNRAIQSQYPPGSTFKIISALAALEEGLITKDTQYYCSGSIYFGRIFRCWKDDGHGDVILHKAIVESCDVYFYEVGKKLDIDILAQYAMGFGLGRPTGIEIEGEVAGIVPSSRWKLETKREHWYKGETLNTVIGQGYLSATPIQMARLMATV